MCVEIKVSNKYTALIDDDDYDKVSKYKWHASWHSHTVYAYTHYPDRTHKIAMHKMILPTKSGYEVHHINHNGLDNRKSNLKEVTHLENAHNMNKNLGESSRFRGVFWDINRNKWAVLIRNGKNKRIFIGRFKTEEKAALAYDLAACKYHGEMAWLNCEHFTVTEV